MINGVDMTNQDYSDWKCSTCEIALESKKTVFEYMKRSFSHEVLCCPNCGKVFIPKALAEGRMAEVEKLLEEK